MQNKAIIRLPQVIKKTGLSRSTIYAHAKKGIFPKPIQIGGLRAVGWVESEIDDYIDVQIDKSRVRA